MYRWLEHTGELELEIEAPTQPAVFSEALEALAELLGGGAAGREELRRIAVEAADPATLLAGWLEELVFLAESEAFVAERAEEIDIAETRLAARVAGRVGDPPHLVKAVTYHGLELTERDDAWYARLVLDV